jgi:hypothetical protein
MRKDRFANRHSPARALSTARIGDGLVKVRRSERRGRGYHHSMHIQTHGTPRTCAAAVRAQVTDLSFRSHGARFSGSRSKRSKPEHPRRAGLRRLAFHDRERIAFSRRRALGARARPGLHASHQRLANPALQSPLVEPSLARTPSRTIQEQSGRGPEPGPLLVSDRDACERRWRRERARSLRAGRLG